MPLWGITDEAKPKWLTDSEKKEVFANTSGWVVEAGSKMSGNGNANAQAEVLCCIGDLANRLQNATITEIELINPVKGGTFDKSEGGKLQVRVRWNEAVTVVSGTPHFVINNTTNAARHQTCLYVSGNNTNELVFEKTLAGGSSDITAGDALNVIANPLALNGGVIRDLGTTTASDITSSTAIGTAAGGFTCVA